MSVISVSSFKNFGRSLRGRLAGEVGRGFLLSRLLRCLRFLLFNSWLLIVGAAVPCRAYSLLSHEEIVDILWKDRIVPLLVARFPQATQAQLRQAHAFAYGGSVIQDVGYYPLGSEFFSDLAHYVRTGDFVANLIRESTDLNEYAFALGALIHFSSDNSGHPYVNQAVAMVFPKLRAKYGDSVTYEDNPSAHIRTEFGFDITQVAKKRYTSDRYHDFIGFQISKPLLERAVESTYGLTLDEALDPTDLAIGTFRRAVSRVIPEMTRAALQVYHPEIVREIPNFNKKQFLYNLSRVQYETEWGKQYRKPRLRTRILECVVRWVPKVSVFKALAFELPTPRTEDLYVKGMNITVENCETLLRRVREGELTFRNMDCDTGRPTAEGEYTLCDRTYARLLDLLMKHDLRTVTPDLRTNILAFFSAQTSHPNLPHSRKARQRFAAELAALRAGPGSPLAEEVRKRLLKPPFKLQSPKAMEQ